MKCKKGSRKIHLSIAGPCVILKVVKEEDSFIRFAERHDDDPNWQWRDRLRGFRTDALFREDPFGVDEFLVPYSLNKKRRWTIPEMLEERIEDVQDPFLRLRVSVSVHTCSLNNRMPQLLQRPWGWERQMSYVEDAPVEAYFDVLRDGTVIHKKHKHAHLDTLDRDTQHAKRPRTDSEFRARFNLPFAEEAPFQPIHIRYNILRLVEDKRPEHPYNRWMLRCNNRRHQRSRIRARRDKESEVKWQFNEDSESDDDTIEDSEAENVFDRPLERTIADFLPLKTHDLLRQRKDDEF